MGKLRRVEDELAECIDELIAGEGDLVKYTSRYPEHREELLALVKLVASLPRLPEDSGPSADWVQQTQEAILKHLP